MLKYLTMTDAQLADLQNEVLVKNKANPEAGVEAWVKGDQKLIDALG